MEKTSYEKIEKRIIERFTNQNHLDLYLRSQNYLEIWDNDLKNFDEEGNYKSKAGTILYFNSPIKCISEFMPWKRQFDDLKKCKENGCTYENFDVDDDLTIISINNKKFHFALDELKLDKRKKVWKLVYNTFCKCMDLDNQQIIFNIKINVNKWQNELEKYQKLIETKYLENLKFLKENTAFIENNKEKPILIYNKLNYNEKINIFKMIFSNKIWEDYAFFGNFAGKFNSRNNKHEFYYLINELINSEFGEYKKISLKWIDEINVFLNWIKSSELIDINSSNLKIYKFESPDFIIEKNSQNIFGVEVTEANDYWYYELRKNSLPPGKIFQLSGINPYENIRKDNLEVIERHFKKQKKYINNILKKQDIKNNIKINNINILYLIPLGGLHRVVSEEKEQIKRIIELSKKHEINPENIYFQINIGKGEKTNSNNWYSLNELEKFINNCDEYKYIVSMKSCNHN